MSHDKAIIARVATILEGVPMYVCSGCEFTTNDEKKLDEIVDLVQRVDAGDIMPAGECPVCGCLVNLHDRHHDEYRLKTFALVLEANGWKVEKP